MKQVAVNLTIAIFEWVNKYKATFRPQPWLNKMVIDYDLFL